ncbi:MAG: ABC transporter substrate-binding protein [Spirochaetaceae bacterium]|nr:ABC transporter substrate-binding protein [Spirochaetaceae bacterium]
MKKLLLFLLLLLLFMEGLTAMALQESTGLEEPDYILKVACLKGPTAFGAIKLFEDQPRFPHGVSSSYELLGTVQMMVARVATGEVDAAVLPLNLAAKLYSQGSGYPMAAVVGRGMVFLLSRDDSIEGWQDLPGKELALAGQGATPDYLLQYFVTQQGISVDQMTINYSFTAPQIAQNAIAGLVNTVIVPEPFATMIELKSPDMLRRLDFQQSWIDQGLSDQAYPMTVVVLSPLLLEDHPQAAEQFLKAYEDSILWVNENSQQAALLIEKFGVMSAALAEPAIKNCNLVYVPALKARDDIEEYLQVLRDFNPSSIGGNLPDEGFYLP